MKNSGRSSARFIPACAGNRPGNPLSCPRGPVHPRVCGEQALSRSGNGPVGGSSPRVRGTAGANPQDAPQPRFIPACAGNRPENLEKHLLRAVHPRVCGEQRNWAACRACVSGSSPRVRGTAGSLARLPARPRFIPACAGNSGNLKTKQTVSPVHPRVCGEQSGWKPLMCKPIHDVKRSTGVSAPPGPGRRASVASFAREEGQPFQPVEIGRHVAVADGGGNGEAMIG